MKVGGKVTEMIKNNRQSSAREIGERLNNNRVTLKLILTKDLNIKRVCAKVIPGHRNEEEE